MLNFSRYCTYKGLQQQNHLHDDITLSVKCYFVTMSLFYCFWHIISCLCIRTLVTVNDLQHKSRESSSCMTLEFWSLWLALHVISVMLYFLRHGHWLSFQQLKRPLLSCVITQYNLRIEWHCGQLCWSWKPLWYTWAAHSQYLQLTNSAFHAMAKWVSTFRLINNNKQKSNIRWRQQQPTDRLMAQVGWLDVACRPLGVVPHSSN